MTLKDLRDKLNNLPNSINNKLKAEEYLEELKSNFIKDVVDFSLDPKGKKEFEHFENLKDKSDAGIKQFIDKLKKKLDEFNNIALKCLKPDSDPKDFQNLRDLFFDASCRCVYGKTFVESIERGSDFYRIRGTDDKNRYKLFSHLEMYMMSSEFSSKIATARFNLSGYPCLYLAESIYLAWEECRRPDFHTANFARFSNCRELKVFNLVIPEFAKLRSLAAFFRAYLSLVCSVKAIDDDKDHWQYRISNLFIKMIYQLDGREIDGIKYMSSKRFENENFKMDYTKECAAYVFPPKNIDDKHCIKLASMFEKTDAYSYFYFKIYGRNFIPTKKAATKEYDKTIFSFLESQLKEEKTTPCKDIIKDTTTIP